MVVPHRWVVLIGATNSGSAVDACLDAAEIIHHDQFAAGDGTHTAGMMGILDACCGRFIEETAHLKIGVSEGFQRQEALVAVGEPRDDGLAGLLRCNAQVRACDEVAPQRGQERGAEFQYGHGAGA